MKHARSDYNKRIQDSDDLIPEDEPVFLIRGQDPAGPATLKAYAKEALNTGASPMIIEKTIEQADAMRKWQKDYPHLVHPADL